MNNPLSSENMQELGQSMAKAVVNTASDNAKAVGHAAVGQLTGSQTNSVPASPSVENLSSSQNPQSSDDKPDDLVNAMYGKSDLTAKSPTVASEVAASKDQEKLQDARTKLQKLQAQHRDNYYVPTFERPKQEEQAVTDKLEEEKQKEMVDLQKKEEAKPQPLAVRQASSRTEANRGTSG